MMMTPARTSPPPPQRATRLVGVVLLLLAAFFLLVYSSSSSSGSSGGGGGGAGRPPPPGALRGRPSSVGTARRQTRRPYERARDGSDRSARDSRVVLGSVWLGTRADTFRCRACVTRSLPRLPDPARTRWGCDRPRPDPAGRGRRTHRGARPPRGGQASAVSRARQNPLVHRARRTVRAVCCITLLGQTDTHTHTHTPYSTNWCGAGFWVETPERKNASSRQALARTRTPHPLYRDPPQGLVPTSETRQYPRGRPTMPKYRPVAGHKATQETLSRPRRSATTTTYNDDDDDAKDDATATTPLDDESDDVSMVDESALARDEEEDDDDDELVDVEDEDDDDDGAPPPPPTNNDHNHLRRNHKRKATSLPTGRVTKAIPDDKHRRKSSRSTKFSGGMAEPPHSMTDVFAKRKDQMLVDTDDDPDESDDDQSTDEGNRTAAQPAKTRRRARSPPKSPAKRHTQRRRSLAPDDAEPEASDDGSLREEENDTADHDAEDEESMGEDEEPLKIQRLIASRTVTLNEWKTQCERMNTSEIHYGSRWFQNEDDDDDKDTDGTPQTKNTGDDFEERFLVKWSDLSFLHASWETQRDLLENVEEQGKAKTHFTSFFKKSINGMLYSQDERCDGDYFDPAWTQIDRILEVQLPEEFEHDSTAMTAEKEDTFHAQSFGMIMDKKNPDFDSGTGRQFLIKWSNTSYTDSTYEFERDLIMNEVEYKDQLKLFLKRNRKPTTTERRKYLRKGEEEYKQLYTIFGDKKINKQSESDRDKAVEQYRAGLQKHVYKNGGQLREYQAEGVAWMISNFVNKRSCILADEMGLGKTLQTAASANLLATALNRGGPILVVAPLSTLQHWHREFCLWTDLNAIVYHGTADDRNLIREYEFVYECDRPQSAIGFNQLYLKKCLRKKTGKSVKADSPWMVDVVVTTPEMMITDDAVELAAVDWEVLVVDEAHRLKNFNSKLATSLRNEKYTFRHKMLLTGTPIQNNVDEFWTLLNFIDPHGFNDLEYFMKKYGDMKSKESVDELHEEIRPYILRRLKEDVEHSVPPKEETLIEVELTVAQKQYYRALYEKNVKFLHKNKSRALDGPSLNNLAMQLRKCCNHLFLLKGVEHEIRRKQVEAEPEGDFLAKASGKLVLLDKLLPRLKAEGHRVLLFSQFKIMLDILEDYMVCRQMKFERIDGSITGNKRQQAIDRFQTPSTAEKEAPFLMMLSTRAGGVGINLTAADTCIIFDSDWNPQNDLQAQARCHRIGQTKSVKIYRLLTRKTYEMQMFHMSSLKMGLDQAVLKGFEGGGSSGDGSMSKEEVEKLLRHGAYDIFNEDKNGEAESNEFVQQDIDSILQRRSRTVVHDNTGSKSNSAGGTFSKASFKVKASNSKNAGDDIDIEDPDFWKKMIGEGSTEDDENVAVGRRQRSKKNYSEKEYKEGIEAQLLLSGASSDSDNDQSDAEKADDQGGERSRWGGQKPTQWKKDDCDKVIKALWTVGYDRMPWDTFLDRLTLSKHYDVGEVKRMCWTIVLLALIEAVKEDTENSIRRDAKSAEKDKLEKTPGAPKQDDGGVLAIDQAVLNSEAERTASEKKVRNAVYLAKHLKESSVWIDSVFHDIVSYSASNEPRDKEQIAKVIRKDPPVTKPSNQSSMASMFAASVWPSLKGRGWKAEIRTEGDSAGKTHYQYNGKLYKSHAAVLQGALVLHPELQNAIRPIIASAEDNKHESKAEDEEGKSSDASLSAKSASLESIQRLLERYGCIQLMFDRMRTNRLRVPRRIITAGSLLYAASKLVKHADSSIKKLASLVSIDKRILLPHPRWTSYQDAVLIHSISKHGWIDNDASVRAIVDDPDVKWGPPFESRGESCASNPSEDLDTSQIVATAERAASCFNSNTLIEELKDFNLNLVTRAYSLKRNHRETEDRVIAPSLRWSVDYYALQGNGHTSSGSTTDPESVCDLPPKKDLVRRAKAVLSRTMIATNTDTTKSPKSPKYDYAELDHSDGASVFLAQLLRAILKEPSVSMYMKKLCGLACEEARSRADSLASSDGFKKADEAAKKLVFDLRRIADHMVEVKRTILKSTTQSKNIVRVILGEEPQKSRREGEPIFPPKRTFSALHMAETKDKKSSRSKGSKLSGKPTGERAIELARKRLLERYGGTAGSEVELDLTEIETIILMTACAVGIPIWIEDWQSKLYVNGTTIHALSWSAFGNIVKGLAEKFFDKAKMNLIRAQTNLNVAAHTAESRGSAQAVLENEQKALGATENVFIQASDYSVEPETLAKKTVMLLAKLICHMDYDSITPSSSLKSDYGLGSKVLNWLEDEITRWAGSLDLLDDAGRPLAFIAIEFLDEIPEAERRAIDIASVINKKGSRMVIGQISLLARIRSFFSVTEQNTLRMRVSEIHDSLLANGDKWDRQPQIGWTQNSDCSLLFRLVVCGMTDSLSTSTLSLADDKSTSATVPYSNIGFMVSKSALQLRANQLVRELHAWENRASSAGVLEESRIENSGAAHKVSGRKGRQIAAPVSANQPVVYSDVEILDELPAKQKVCDLNHF